MDLLCLVAWSFDKVQVCILNVSKSDRYCLTSYVFGYISLIKKVKAKFELGGFFRIRFQRE